MLSNSTIYVAVLEPHDNEKEVLGVFSDRNLAVKRLLESVEPSIRSHFWFWIEHHVLNDMSKNQIMIEGINFEDSI